jgi:deoxyribodipyrimidine photo-lyase
LASLNLNRSVEALGETVGGAGEANYRLDQFLARRLSRYPEERNFPEQNVTSELSPYLHFGHISAHRVFRQLADSEGWSLEKLAEKPTGRREGWWNMSQGAEAFLDQLITWRELGFNMCWSNDSYTKYESLPQWARTTLEEHRHDTRRWVYPLARLESASTHDPLWNAAQRQLVRTGTIHNYLRMLWGKKILEWSASPQDALEHMIELNDKYALDGRDPNSYSGIFWVLGRYDRAWGPERPVFGKIRYMSSENTARKVDVESYLHWFRD